MIKTERDVVLNLIFFFGAHQIHASGDFEKKGLLLACGRWSGVLFFQGERDSVGGFVSLLKNHQTKSQKKNHTRRLFEFFKKFKKKKIQH